MTEITPRIYVACLAAYNNGILHGEWIDADQGVEHISEQAAAMLKASPIEDAEEWAIHDYEGFEGFDLSEWEGFAQVAEKAEFIAEHGRIGTLIADHYGNDLTAAREAMEDRYFGEWDNMTEFAEHLTEETGELAQIPDHLAYYIDFEAMGRDMVYGGGWICLEDGHKTHVFAEG